jgi:ankyrin repeat protein
MSFKVSINRFLIPAFIFCLAGRLTAQISEIDTSDYLPLYLDGALEYNLTIAASSGYSSEVERLILAGAEVDVETSQGATPLYFAIINRKPEAVKTLIEYGADVNKTSVLNETPLLLAINVQNLEIAETLIRGGADINYQNKAGVTPLHYASIYGYFYFVDLLLYYEAEVNKKANDGTTPLMAAIWAGYPEIADLLMQHGANLEARDNEGFTPFLIAAQNGDTLMINMLRKKGVDIYEKNIYNWDALSYSIKSNHVQATEMLIKAGNEWADPKREAVNPFNIAARYRRKEIFEILENNNIPGGYDPKFNQIALSFSSKFTTRDIYTGFSFSFKEPLKNFGLVTGFDTKLWYTRVLVEEMAGLYYQYLDKSSVVYAGVFKDYPLTDNLFRGNFCFTTALSVGYSFGNKFKGTEIAQKNKFRILPSASLKWVKNDLAIFTGLEYMNSDFYRIGPVWVRMGCSYNFFFDYDRAPGKVIKWY